MNRSTVLGLDNFLEKHTHLVKGKKVGLISNQTVVNGEGIGIVTKLLDHNVNLQALYAPEHGFYGTDQDGLKIDNTKDFFSKLPIYSLFNEKRRFTSDMVKGIDTVIIDLQDIGCRYWTYLYTMSRALESAVEFGFNVLLFDRPNPITGLNPEGNILDPAFHSFVGEYPIPMRTGITMGEAAYLFNEYFKIGADLEVIPMKNWRRSMWYEDTGLIWVAPSPNMPTVNTATLYPGTCLFEGTNVSEGRGSTKPFELIGAPWLDPYLLAERLNKLELKGIFFRPAFFTPKYRKYTDKQCFGVQLHILDRKTIRPVLSALHLLTTIYEQDKAAFQWQRMVSDTSRYQIDRLAGTDQLRKDIEKQIPAEEIWESWCAQLQKFLPTRQQFLLYD